VAEVFMGWRPFLSPKQICHMYVKNCSLYTLLMATDQKPQKLQKGTIKHTSIT